MKAKRAPGNLIFLFTVAILLCINLKESKSQDSGADNTTTGDTSTGLPKLGTVTSSKSATSANIGGNQKTKYISGFEDDFTKNQTTAINTQGTNNANQSVETKTEAVPQKEASQEQTTKEFDEKYKTLISK